jgi:hypothetical protein
MWSPRLSRSRSLVSVGFPITDTVSVSSGVSPVAVLVDADSRVTLITGQSQEMTVLPAPAAGEAALARVAAGTFWKCNVVFVGTSVGTLVGYSWNANRKAWTCVGSLPVVDGGVPATFQRFTWASLDIVEEQSVSQTRIRLVLCCVLQPERPGSSATAPATFGAPVVSVVAVEVDRSASEAAAADLPTLFSHTLVFRHTVQWRYGVHCCVCRDVGVEGLHRDVSYSVLCVGLCRRVYECAVVTARLASSRHLS